MSTINTNKKITDRPIVKRGPIIDSFNGIGIDLWFETNDGSHYEFVDIYQNITKNDLMSGEALVPPCFLYKKRDENP